MVTANINRQTELATDRSNQRYYHPAICFVEEEEHNTCAEEQFPKQ